MTQELVTLVKELIKTVNRIEKINIELREEIREIKHLVQKIESDEQADNTECCNRCKSTNLIYPSECDVCGKTYCHQCLYFGFGYNDTIKCMSCEKS